MGNTGKHIELPGGVTILDGRGELPMVQVKTPWSSAEVYLHGAHVTHFQKNGEPPLLFLSQCSRFAEGQPVRGGVPIIYPWFGANEGKKAQHGFARNKDWELTEVLKLADESVSLRFQLPDCVEANEFPKFALEFLVTVGESLLMELTATNNSSTSNLEFENCLHTYFAVGDISSVSIHGLRGVNYLDKTDYFVRKVEPADAIRINSETDRTYIDTTFLVEIRDTKLARKIIVEKQNSASTVVWNPWIERARQLSDFGDEEYKQMICVESGNVGPNKIVLPPGKSSSLQVRVKSQRLD